MPKSVKTRVMRVIKENRTTPEEISIINIQLGQVIADAVHYFSEQQGFNIKEDVDLIGGQGQTVRIVNIFAHSVY